MKQNKSESKKNDQDTDSDQKANSKEAKWWLLKQPGNKKYDMKTYWESNNTSKKRKNKQDSDSGIDSDSTNHSIRPQTNPFDPPKNNSYQLMTVCRKNKRSENVKHNKNGKRVNDNEESKYKRSKITKLRKVDVDDIDDSIDKMRIKQSKYIKFDENSYDTEIDKKRSKNVNLRKIDVDDYDEVKIKFSESNKVKRSEKEVGSNDNITSSSSGDDQIQKRKIKGSSKQIGKHPERKKKIPFLEISSSNSEDEYQIRKNDEGMNKIPKNIVSIDKEDNHSFYHLSDYRIPSNNEVNDSLKPLNLKIIENPSHSHFDDELSDAEIRLLPNQFKKFFEIMANHLKTKSDDHKLCMKILITIDSVLFYEQAFDSLIKSEVIDNLPLTTPKLIILSFKILKLLFMFRPSRFQEDFLPSMKHFLYTLPSEMILSLLILYAHSFEFIENPWPILDLLIQNKDIFFKQEINDDDIQKFKKIRKYFNEDPGVEADFCIDDIDFSYLSVLLYLNTNFPIYRKNRLKYCRSVFIQSLFDPTISKKSSLVAYKAVLALYDSEFEEQINVSYLFSDLKEKEFENYSLLILSKMNVDLIPIKNKYIFQLINSSHVDEKASLILQKMMGNSQRNEKIALILLQNPKWLRYGLPTFSHTSMIFQSCIKFENSNLINNVKNCKELPFFFTALLQSDNINDIQSISFIIQEIDFDDFESLSKNDFFVLLFDIISNGQDRDILPYIDLLSDLASIQFSIDYKKFIKILKNMLKSDAKIFHHSLKAIANLSVYEECAILIQNQNIISVAAKFCQSQSDNKLLQKIKRNIK